MSEEVKEVYLVLEPGEDAQCFKDRFFAVAYTKELLSNDWLRPDFGDDARLEAFQHGKRDLVTVFVDQNGEQVRLEAVKVKP